MASKQDNSRSLTGVWNGLYSYPHSLPPVSFTAILIESGASFSGTTHEPGKSVGVSGVAYATLEGQRTGSSITFAKTYDGGGASHAVLYDGRINENVTEIEGRWRVPGNWSGKFLMIRAGGKDEAVRAEKLEPVGER
jgi:hypothetical protein